ncbi:uncharacterized protein Z520_03206 [Fonsecaea multimorphosa CBS 102226]|uniref:Protein HRI1 n=1 Tax=Fonsecaea multimorphosa CBS 102226 TaxID=1442371 RepID=A0A0D2K400_9EURO|nr:uncharacterized protein Z520_03206 [Fonsecaea multimorphosa CBS 102226]KIY00543.1 hypothetical protein Z520_03206 [Fonsecaea multimorphosa CBS 102226]OAL18939.1 hypothetical protein AYO22_10268 [Fonsecaea multimorphosa]
MEIYGMLGERLGTIGEVKKEEDKAEGAEFPQWKKDLLRKPSISIRKGIAWGYTPPYEDTDTLVLTSPKSSFVDIRFPVKRQLGEPITSDPSFWAFSGTSHMTFAPFTGDTITMPYSAHCVWKHEIDSKGPGITDEGDLFLLPNADCIEVGSMQNPQTGKVEMYKEYWTGPPTNVAPTSAALDIRTPCVVAKAQAPSSDGQNMEGTSSSEIGIVIRIGNYCQGIMRQQTGEQGWPEARHAILVERWTRNLVETEQTSAANAGGSEEPNDAASWVQDWRSNTPCDDGVFLPCMWTCDGNRKLGDEIVVQGISWRIVELVLKKVAGEEA